MYLKYVTITELICAKQVLSSKQLVQFKADS